MFGMKKEEIMKEFINGSKKINIDYKHIEDYNQEFVMILKVNGKDKEEVWKVKNGKEAKNIRDKYKKIGRSTSYVAFYKNVEDLKSEQNEDLLQFRPRIRGKNEIKYEQIQNIVENEESILKINVKNEQIAYVLNFVAELNGETLEELVTQILENYLIEKFKGDKR